MKTFNEEEKLKLINRFTEIHMEVFGYAFYRERGISKMEKALVKEFVEGREDEAGVRNILEKVKLFNT